MALVKEITLENGITLNYHKISLILIDINSGINIHLASVPSKELYKKSLKKQLKNQAFNMYIEGRHYSHEYVKDFNIDDAYAYLKTLDEFAGAEDDDDTVTLDIKAEVEAEKENETTTETN